MRGKVQARRINCMDTAQTRRWSFGLLALLLAVAAPAYAKDIEVVEGRRGRGKVVETNPIFLDDSPAAQELVSEAHRLRRDGRPVDAVVVYQQVVDQHARRVLRLDERRYLDAQRWVEMELLGDPQLLQVYRRVMEPMAQRQLMLAMQSPQQAEGLEKVVQNYRLCTVGFEAALRLAGLYLEQGNADDAMAVLDQLEDHPDLTDHAARWHWLAAAASLYARQNDRLETHRRALKQLDASDRLAQIDQWIDRLRRPAGFDPIAADQQLAELRELGTPLWDWSVAPRSTLTRIAVSDSRPLYPVVPVVAGEIIYLNTNERIEAIDRISKELLWEFPLDAAIFQVRAGMRATARNQFRPNQRSVLLTADRLYAVLGLDLSQPWTNQEGRTSLVCLDRLTGRLLWKVKAGDVDASLGSAVFHGTPFSGGGRVYVLMRRRQSGVSDAEHVVALDAEDGSLRWRRFLASISTPRHQQVSPHGQMLVQDGRLFIIDHLGTVSCLQQRTGAIEWLRKVDAGATADQVLLRAARMSQTRFDSPPVLIEAGLVVNPYRSASAMLLDPATGQKLRDLTDRVISGSAYLMASGTDMLSVGRTVYLLDGATLETRWKHQLSRTGSHASMGRPALTGRALWVASGDQLHVLDIENGHVLLVEQTFGDGNVVVHGAGVLLATATKLFNHMRWDMARQGMIERIAKAPDDPGRGLALARLAAAAGGHDQAVLKGIDHALAALAERRRQDRDYELYEKMIFDQLSLLLQSTGVSNPLVREQLFNRMERVATTPDDQVWYLLALADFQMRMQRPSAAVRQYQRILTAPVLAAVQYAVGPTTRQAAMEATSRLKQIVGESDDPSIYEQFETEAARKLIQQTGVPMPDPETLVELARQYPCASAAPVARLAAAEVYAGAGNMVKAVTQLRRAYVEATESVLVARVVGRLAELYEQREQPNLAYRVLRRAQAEYGALAPLRGSIAVDIEDWINQLAQHGAATRHLPRFETDFGKPRVVTGRLLVSTHQSVDRRATELFATLGEQSLQLRDRQDLHAIWTVPIPGGRVQLLSLTDDEAIMWLPVERSLFAIDCATGRRAWGEDVQVADLFGHSRLSPRLPPQVVRGRIDLALRDGAGEMIRFQLGDTMICMTNRDGRVAAIDRTSGQTLWVRRVEEISQLDHLSLGGDILVLGGRGRKVQGRGNRGGTVVVLDAATGTPRMPTVATTSVVRALKVIDAGFVVALENELAAYQVEQGRVLWQQQFKQGRIMEVFDSEQDVLLVIDAVGSMVAINPLDGTVHNRIALPEGLGGLNLSFVDHQWQLLTASHAVALDPFGKLRWRDAIYDVPKSLRLQLIGDKHVIVLAEATSSPRRRERGAVIELQRGGHHYHLHVLDRRNGTILRKQDLEPLPEPIVRGGALLLDDRILLSTKNSTIVIPAAGSE